LAGLMAPRLRPQSSSTTVSGRPGNFLVAYRWRPAAKSLSSSFSAVGRTRAGGRGDL